jgi:hypothetical protein
MRRHRNWSQPLLELPAGVTTAPEAQGAAKAVHPISAEMREWGFSTIRRAASIAPVSEHRPVPSGTESGTAEGVSYLT